MAFTRVIGTFSAWDYVVFAGMLVISAAIGIYYAFIRGGQNTSSEFFAGSRNLAAVPVALSLTSSFMSAVTVLGTPAEVYRFGSMYSIFGFSFFFASIISAEIFLPVFYRLGITSANEYLELRFNRAVRIIGTIIFILLMVIYTGIVIYAPALALTQVTGLNLWGAVVITGAVCTFYCTVGGIRAVVLTDVFQVAVMVAGFAAIIIRTVVVQGGIDNIIQHSYEGGRLHFWDFNPNPLQRHTFWSIAIGGTFTWTSVYGINQAQVQRYIACKSRFQAKLALYINLIGLWVILVCTVLCGLCIYSVYRDCDPWTANLVTAPDQLLPFLVMDILGDYPGVPGLFVACAYSGTLSTVSSTINALAAVTLEDLIKPCFPSLTEKKLSWMAKVTSFFYGALCIAMSAVTSYLGSVIQAAISIFGMVGGPLLGLFSLGMLFSFTNPAGAITGLICGFAISLWTGAGGQLYPPLPERRLALNLTTAGCNISSSDLHNWTSTTVTPMLTTLMQPEATDRPAIADYWYSLSYVYLSTLGTLVTILVGVLVSLLSGGRQQNIDRKYLHSRKDLSFDIFSWCRRDSTKYKFEDLDLSPYPDVKQQKGVLNPAFQDAENHFPENKK